MKHEPTRMFIGDLEICAVHRDSFNIQDLLSEDGRNRIKVAFYQAGKAQPDLDDIAVEFIPLDLRRK